MLFNSYEFIFLFLPITTALYFLVRRQLGFNAAIGVLVAASLFYYSYWNPIYLPLLLFSIGFNYVVGSRYLASRERHSKVALVIGIAVNLALLGYFKYANFFVDNVNAIAGLSWQVDTIVLPLAISFFTFQQISYLVDSWNGLTKQYRFLHYCLFVSFFPQLIAGPIVHHGEMLPQFAKDRNLDKRQLDIAIGISIFALGLFKKAVIADSLSPFVTPVFDAPSAGDLDLFRAWGATLAYTFQLYFDFSGYSDMAVGAARLFGIRLPINFFSPYKATSIVDFWRRWHISLSRFLRDYLYIALGGNRHGRVRRYANLWMTMLLGGLWHGAGWTFVIWGALHGTYLMINHAWNGIAAKFPAGVRESGALRAASWALTFFAVVLGWVYFRAPDIDTANGIIAAMLGANGAELPAGLYARLDGLTPWLESLGIGPGAGSGSQFVLNYLWVMFAAALALLCPNVLQLFRRYRPVLVESRVLVDRLDSDVRLHWSLRPLWAATVAGAFVFAVLTLTRVSEFLYFQF